MENRKGGWIKMRRDLWTNPKVVTLSSRINATKAQAIGALHGLWSMFDAHSDDGFMRIDPPEALDDMFSTPGFVQACVEIGWLEVGDDGTLYLPRYQEHNGPTAKKRASDSDRQSRNRHASVRKMSHINATKTETETEKRQREEEEEEQNTSSSGDDGATSQTNSKPKKSRTAKEAESVYLGYPRKVGKQAALRAIAKALKEIRARGEPEPVEWLKSRALLFAASDAGQQGKFTPHPATWFNRGSYDDDPEQWGKNPSATDPDRKLAEVWWNEMSIEKRAEVAGLWRSTERGKWDAVVPDRMPEAVKHIWRAFATMNEGSE